MDRIVQRAAKTVFSGPIEHPLGVGKGDEPELQCHATSRSYASAHDCQVVHGFSVGKLSKNGTGKLALFTYHSIVRSPDRRLVDPNFTPGNTRPFIEDPGRSYDYALGIGWNMLVVANTPFRCLVTGVDIPPWQVVWATFVSGVPAYSTNPLHARKRHFGNAEEAPPYVAEIGLDPSDPVDLCFATNAEIVSVEIEEGEPPPKQVKDYKLANGIRHPSGIRPVPASIVLSEAEEAELRRR